MEKDFYNAIKGFFLRRTPSEQIAEDLTQDVFFKIAKTPDLEDIVSIKSWIFLIAKNTLIDYYRKKNTTNKEGLVSLGIEKHDINIKEQEIDDVLSCVFKMLRELDVEERLIIEKIYIEGISQRVLSEEMNLNYSTLKSRLQKSLLKLKQALLSCCDFKKDRLGRTFDCNNKNGDC